MAEVEENSNTQELQETVSRLSSHKGVEAVMILNHDGDIMAETGSLANTNHAKHTKKLMEVATTYIKSLGPEDEVSFLQIQTEKGRSIMISPHQGYCLAVLKK